MRSRITFTGGLIAVALLLLSAMGCKSEATKACEGQNPVGNSNVPPSSPARSDCDYCCGQHGSYQTSAHTDCECH